MQSKAHCLGPAGKQGWKSTLLYSVLDVIQLYWQKQISQVKQFLTIFSWRDKKNKRFCTAKGLKSVFYISLFLKQACGMFICASLVTFFL